MHYAIFLAFIGFPAIAETPLDGAAFQALVEGKTLTFSEGTMPYGMEYYAPDRRVIWSHIGGECMSGEWYEVASESGPNICFVYTDDPEPKCWQIFDIDGQIRANFMSQPGTTVLYQAVDSEPLVCRGVGT